MGRPGCDITGSAVEVQAQAMISHRPGGTAGMRASRDRAGQTLVYWGTAEHRAGNTGSWQRDSPAGLAHGARRAIPRHDLNGQPPSADGRVGLSKLPGVDQRAGSVERQPTQRTVRLIADGAIRHDVARRAQPGVIGQMLLLDALQHVLRIGGRILRPAQQHQLERFKLHKALLHQHRRGAFLHWPDQQRPPAHLQPR
jgi:hypothetical protein